MGAQESTSSDPIVNLIRNHLLIMNDQKQTSYTEAFTTGVQKQSQNKQSNSKQTNNKLLTIKDLRLNQINDGRLGIFILLPPVQLVSIMFPILDCNGNCVMFALYNNTNRQPIQQQFQVGQKLEICNPFFKMGNDGRELIKVENPNNLIFVDSNLDEYFKGMTNLLSSIHQTDQILPQEIINIQKQYKQLAMSPQGQDWFSNVNQKLKNDQKNIPQQEQQNQEQPHWKGHHVQMDKMMNTSFNDMIDSNQKMELSEMMTQKEIFIRFQLASTLVQQDKQRAMNIFENLLQDYQNYAVIYFNYGELAFELGIYDKCLRAMRSFLQLHKKKKFIQSQIYNFAHYHIGFSLMMLGQNEEGEQFLKEACKLDPQNLTFQQALSEFYFRNKQFKQAEDLSLQLVKQFDNKKRDFDDKVELQRSIHILFKLSQQEQNFENLVKYADNLAQLDEENFIYIYNDITHYFLDQLQDKSRKELIQFLQKSNYFDIICEELQLLYLLNLNDQEQKTQQLELQAKTKYFIHIINFEELFSQLNLQ